eukprot:scaffold3179_cov59-Phaeocystis_antarctica.AAC.10
MQADAGGAFVLPSKPPLADAYDKGTLRLPSLACHLSATAAHLSRAAATAPPPPLRTRAPPPRLPAHLPAQDAEHPQARLRHLPAARGALVRRGRALPAEPRLIAAPRSVSGLRDLPGGAHARRVASVMCECDASNTRALNSYLTGAAASNSVFPVYCPCRPSAISADRDRVTDRARCNMTASRTPSLLPPHP